MMFNIAGRSFNVEIEKQSYAGLSFWNECHELMYEEEQIALNKAK